MTVPIIAYVSAYSCVIPAVTGWVRVKSMEREFIWLFWLFTANVIVSVGQTILGLNQINNLWLSHCFVILEYAILIRVYSSWVRQSKSKFILRVSILVASLFWLISKITLERFDQAAFLTSPMFKSILTLASLYMIFTIAHDTRVTVFNQPRFWVAAAVLLSSAGSLMFFALRNVIDRLSREEMVLAYSIHWILDIAVNIIYTIGLLCKPTLNSGGRLASAQQL